MASFTSLPKKSKLIALKKRSATQKNKPILDHHPLRLLASAIVGYPLYISYLLKEDIKPYSDGRRIFLQYNDTLETHRAQIFIQCALIVGQSLNNQQMAGIVGRYELRRRYFILEVERCCTLLSERLPNSLLNRLKPYYSGHLTQDAADSLKLAASSISLKSPPDWFGGLQPFRLLKNAPQKGGQPLEQKTLSEMEEQLKQLNLSGPEGDDDEDKIEKSSLWKALSSPLGSDGMMAQVLWDLLDMASAPDNEPTSSEASGSSESVSGKILNHMGNAMQILKSKLALTLPSTFTHDESGAHCYPEWDFQKQKYHENWVNVEEVEPQSTEEIVNPRSLSRHGDIPYQRALIGLVLNYQRHKHQPQGDDIMVDQLVKLAVDIKTGYTGNPAIYSASLKTKRDLGVQILLDTSSSTLDFSTDSTGQKKRIFDAQVEISWRLCRAFSALGDRVALHGFHSWGRTLVRFQRLKTFDERIGSIVEQRLKKISIAGYTRMGAAIRHATSQIQQFSGMPHQLLILVSDGYPYDDQYEGQYASEDTKKALEEARSQNVACLCLSVGSDTDHDRLKQVYGEVNYLSLDQSKKLPSLLRSAIESALNEISKPS